MNPNLLAQPWVYIAALGARDQLTLGDEYLTLINEIISPMQRRACGTSQENWIDFRVTLNQLLKEKLGIKNLKKSLQYTIDRIPEPQIRKIFQIRFLSINGVRDNHHPLSVCTTRGCLNQQDPYDCLIEDCNQQMCKDHSIIYNGQDYYCSDHGYICPLCDRQLPLIFFNQNYQCAASDDLWCNECGNENTDDRLNEGKVVPCGFCQALLGTHLLRRNCFSCHGTYLCQDCGQYCSQCGDLYCPHCLKICSFETCDKYFCNYCPTIFHYHLDEESKTEVKEQCDKEEEEGEENEKEKEKEEEEKEKEEGEEEENENEEKEEEEGEEEDVNKLNLRKEVGNKIIRKAKKYLVDKYFNSPNGFTRQEVAENSKGKYSYQKICQAMKEFLNLKKPVLEIIGTRNNREILKFRRRPRVSEM
jgi:hypothetical protein